MLSDCVLYYAWNLYTCEMFKNIFISFVQLAYLICMFSWLSCVVLFSFAMITLLVWADEVVGLETPLRDK